MIATATAMVWKMTASSSATVSSSSGSSGGPSVGWWLLTVFVSSAVVAAGISAWASARLTRRKSREEERARVRTVFAEAFEAVAAYKEFPYAIRRRAGDEPARERVRLSEELRAIQTRLTYYSAWIHAESTTVGDAYDMLVTELRKVAGQACHDAWEADPITDDKDMNIGPDLVDLSSLKDHEKAYTTAAESYLANFLRRRRS